MYSILCLKLYKSVIIYIYKHTECSISMHKVEMDKGTCFPFELIGTRELIQIFASPSTISWSHFFSQEQFEEPIE